PPFALDKSAGNSSGSVGVLAVVDGEREKVDALPRVRVGAGSGENNVIADAHNARAMRLLRQFASFKVNGFAAVQLDADFKLVDAVQCSSHLFVHFLSSFRSEHNRYKSLFRQLVEQAFRPAVQTFSATMGDGVK